MVAYIFAVACLFMTAISSSLALDYTVGDAAGWGLGVDFSAWSSGKSFHVGDNLVFKYGPAHTVAEVTLEDYNSCPTGDSVNEQLSGYTKIALKTPGTHYFICSVTGHCAAGMKLEITVSIGGLVTTMPPGSSPPTPPTGVSAIPQMVYSSASAIPPSYGSLPLLFLLLAIKL